ncbi:predicted protein [Uncinocarpus reesii 1704]|uniref:Uncharacterized protein n=1 Tax=Uncinocarpus reesii (strain UAMH 1704) TaxID=336963 RepID=C4JX25_UNCRE|nr:uncharacterized protein UREG_06198 [Uncinocarpus reesii 1704]EEP81333.1 predicted protein [Uncinocarpus reesii 1704]
MFRIISCLRAPMSKWSLPLLCTGKRTFSEVVTCRSTSSRAGTNTSSSNIMCCRSPTCDDSDELSPLDQGQLAQLFSGRFPADFSGEAIYVRTSRNDFHKLVDAFDRTSDERKRTISLEFDKQFSTTTVRLKQTTLHGSVIDFINDQLRRHIHSKSIFYARNYCLLEGLSEPDFQVRYRKQGSKLSDPLMAFEVGFSQPSEELEQKVKALLEKSSTKVGIMFDFKESPKYKNPFILVFSKNSTTGKAVAKTRKMLFYGRQETVDQQWKQRPQIQRAHSGKDLGECGDRASKAGENEGEVHNGEKGINDDDKQNYVADPELNVALADFLPFHDPMDRKALTFDWDWLRSILDDCKGDLAEARIANAIMFLRNKGEQV